jgi:hypothetical protein
MHGTSSPMTRKLSAQSPHASMLKRSVNKAVGITPKAVRTSNSGSFGVQIGAFRSKGEASKRLAKVVQGLPNRLGEPDPIVAQFTDAEHGTYFRARLIGFQSRAAAAQTCRWLKDQRTDCIIVASAQ